MYRIVVSAPSGSGALTKIPEVTHIFSPAGPGPAFGVGVWGSGGVVLHGGALYTVAGNTINSANEWDALGEHVIKLNPVTMQCTCVERSVTVLVLLAPPCPPRPPRPPRPASPSPASH